MKKEELLKIILDDVKPSAGCTEPACLAYIVSRARAELGGIADKVKITISPNVYRPASVWECLARVHVGFTWPLP